jgi:hypothetical protein
MTVTANQTLAGALDQADPNKVADALRQVKLGTLLTPTKQTISQTSAVTVALTPPALVIHTVRVTGGTALAGIYQVADTDATEVDSATLGVCTLSDDGATLTFAAAVTDLVVIYVPRSDADLTADFPTTGVG